MPSQPEFPLRIIHDDGEVVEIASPEALMLQVDTIDTRLEADHLWIRDVYDQTVQLVMRGGMIVEFEVVR
jgi:hypothetical protein